ncbi:MAG: substrate-binding domain-containing protein [Flavobacteriales bacterium]|nr:substrate-binding domain-containing protein [Flavobacteriales bacterium]
MNRINFLWLVVFTLGLFSCKNYDRNADSIQSGKLKIGIDDSYTLMMDSQIFVFEQIYKYADVVPFLKPEADVITDLLNDSIQAAVICRPLNEAELAMFKAKDRLPESVAIAQDGLAFILHPDKQDSVFTMAQVEGFFTGEVGFWSQISSTGGDDEITIVFDNNKSCNYRYIKERFLKTETFPTNCFAVNSNEEVINYVATHPDAIGVISVSWISDVHDPTANSFVKKVKVAGIIDPANLKKPGMPRKPVPAYIYDKSYPFHRTVYAIRTGLKGTLGTGFVSHLAGEKGQLIMQKMGMVPTTLQVRTVNTTP